MEAQCAAEKCGVCVRCAVCGVCARCACAVCVCGVHVGREGAGRDCGEVPMPGALFYQELKASMQSEGLTLDVATTSRTQWPRQLLKGVFHRLSQRTPRQLLERELWLSSTTASEWWTKTSTYSRSLAVMSVVGFIIGLGDRHLDNILLDFQTGGIIHIDYGVCFDKGIHLKVPEVVPFRLTPMLQTALGVTAVEGRFRIACESTLHTLRRESELLLSLLSAFVYDPLLDWSKAAEDDRARRKLELIPQLS